MPPDVGRVAVDEVARLCNGDSHAPILHNEVPILTFHRLPRPLDLIDDLGNERRAEPFRLAAERDVEATFLVKAHHPIEAGAAQEQEVKGIAMLIEALANGVVMGLSLLQQFRSFAFQVLPNGAPVDRAVLDAAVKVNHMLVGVGE